MAKDLKDNSDAIANAIGQIEKGIEALKNEVLEVPRADPVKENKPNHDKKKKV